MSSTRKQLVETATIYATHTNRSPKTISRLCTGSGATLERIMKKAADGSWRHRIWPERLEAALQWLSDNWPSDLDWPDHIERPAPTEEKTT
jgi:hypothetical protein